MAASLLTCHMSPSAAGTSRAPWNTAVPACDGLDIPWAPGNHRAGSHGEIDCRTSGDRRGQVRCKVQLPKIRLKSCFLCLIAPVCTIFGATRVASCCKFQMGKRAVQQKLNMSEANFDQTRQPFVASPTNPAPIHQWNDFLNHWRFAMGWDSNDNWHEIMLQIEWHSYASRGPPHKCCATILLCLLSFCSAQSHYRTIPSEELLFSAGGRHAELFTLDAPMATSPLAPEAGYVPKYSQGFLANLEEVCILHVWLGAPEQLGTKSLHAHYFGGVSGWFRQELLGLFLNWNAWLCPYIYHWLNALRLSFKLSSAWLLC